MEVLRRNAVPIGKKNSTKFRVDISKHEYCGAKQQHFLDGYQVFGYSPVMFVCEKLRAICQQMPEYVAIVKGRPTARARDFVDIHTVTEHYDVDYAADEFARILNRVFEIKRVPLSLLGKIKNAREQHIDDFIAVRNTVYPDFDFYFDYVAKKCELLKILGNE